MTRVAFIFDSIGGVIVDNGIPLVGRKIRAGVIVELVEDTVNGEFVADGWERGRRR